MTGNVFTFFSTLSGRMQAMTSAGDRNCVSLHEKQHHGNCFETLDRHMMHHHRDGQRFHIFLHAQWMNASMKMVPCVFANFSSLRTVCTATTLAAKRARVQLSPHPCLLGACEMHTLHQCNWFRTFLQISHRSEQCALQRGAH